MELELFTTPGNAEYQSPKRRKFIFSQDPGVENQVVNLYPEIKSDVLEGFGGAITDSAAYVYSLMNKHQRETLMKTYFSPQKMNYGLVRIPMDSCDFSLETYEAMSDPEDRLLKSFSFVRTKKYILPMLNDAQKAAGRPLELMLSPWSPPAFMKTNGQRTHGGSLKLEYRELWAEYLCRYILEFRERGYKVRRISLQNEPRAAQAWDSCVFTAQEQKDFLVEHMAPAMKRHGLEDVEVFLWDHNKERVYEWMRDILDQQTSPLVAGAAFHWYSGDHFESLELARRAFPDKKLILSESCIEFKKFRHDDDVQNALRLSHEIIGDLNHGMTAFYDWNLLLNEKGGPNYVKNYCLAPFLFDTVEKELMPQLVQRHLAHFSGYLSPGSVRIEHSRYTDILDITAWQRPDGSLAMVLLNKAVETSPVYLRLNGQVVKCRLPPQSISTGVIGFSK